MLGFLIELESCVVEEVWVLWYLARWQGRLDVEVFFEGHIIAVGFDPALDKIEKELTNSSTPLELPVEVTNLP